VNWIEYKLGELIHVKHGYAFKSEYFAAEGTEIVLTPGNFYEEGGFKLRGDKDRFYSGIYPKEFLLAKNQIIIAMTEQGEGLLGSAALIPDDNKYLHNQRLGLVTVKDPAKIDPYYLYKLFNTQEIRLQIFASATGAKVRHTAPERVYKCKALLPPLPIQEKISRVLSAYDDLIEANLKRIKLLEEMAQITYEEWFVRMRFHGHETTPTNPETGLPEGWTPKVLKEFFPIKTGKKDANIQTADGMYPFFTCSQGIYRCDVYSFDAEAIILSGNGEFNVKYYRGKFEAYQRNYVLIPNNREFLFLLFLFIRHFLGRITAGSKGSVIKYLTKDLIADTKFIEPSRIILDEFNKLAFPVFYQIENLEKQNALLKEARDLLLPRLMTGLIDIDEYLARNGSAAVAV